MPMFEDLKVISGNAHPAIASDICAYLGISLAECEVFKFSNDNTFVRILENIRQRDVFFIQTIQRDGDPMVYRNEDTGWGWPPYFKFDTSNLQTQASDLRSTADNPRWVKVTHYGWRVEFWTVFPNAISVKLVDDPDQFIIPWLNIFILLVFAAICWAIRVRWIRFRERRIDPLVEDVDESWDSISDSARDKRGRLSRWFASWRR